MLNNLRTVDLKASSIPDDIILKKDCVTLNEGIKEIANAYVFFRESLPPNNSSSCITILLLHGHMFSSKTWIELGTLQMLAAMGYRTIAIDLPGYGNTDMIMIPDKASFLQLLLDAFNLKNPVIVSPSMSGIFTLPYLVKKSANLVGYIPVAPLGYEVLEELPISKDLSVKNEVYGPLQEYLYNPLPDLSFIETPAMIVFGEKDRSRSSALLSLLPNSQCQEIPDGQHPAYLDNPPLWHQLLYNFLLKLSKDYRFRD